MDTDSEYYNIYGEEPDTKIYIYHSILYFIIFIYGIIGDIFIECFHIELWMGIRV